jgi:hypothetical protein
MKRRQQGLIGALGLTLAATWWAAGVDTGADEDSVARPAERTPASTRAMPRRASDGVSDLSALGRARPAFAARAPAVFGLPPAPPAPVVRRAPSAAVAPALPYTYIGSIQEGGGERLLFLLDGERLVTARVGEVLDARYRINAADESAITLTYLPLQQEQRISLADRS